MKSPSFLLLFLILCFKSFAQPATILNCDGSNDYVSIPQVISSDFTIEYWVKTTMTGPTGSGSSAQWWSGIGVVDAEVPFYQYDYGTSLYGSKLAFGIGDYSNGDVTIFSSSNINTGNWVHIAVNWTQSTGAMNLYINGVLESYSVGSTIARTTPTAINIGRLLTGVNGYLDGSIDELRIWNYARSQSQIAANMYCELNLGTTQTGLLSYYQFNQGIAAGNNSTVTILTDLSGNNHTGTLYNFALSGSFSNWLSGTPMSGIPIINISSTSQSVCSGQSATITANGAPTYTWNTNATTSSIVVSPYITTIYSVSSSNTGCTGSASMIIYVNPTPTVICNVSTPSVCLGASVNISASGASSYTWQPVNLIGSSINVIPLVSTIYSIDAISSQSCSSSQTVLITVVNPPALVLTPSSQSICAGASCQFSVSGANTYSWNPGGLMGSQISVVPLNSTIYTVTGVTGAGCSSTETIAIQVSPNPTVTAITNPTSICAGGSSTLTAMGATNYTWLPGQTNGSVIIVSPSSTITYTVLGESNTCISSTNVIITNALNPNIISGGNIDCLNSMTQIFVTSNSSNSVVTWAGPGIIGANTGSVVNVNAAGIYTALITNTLTGCSAMPTLSVANTIAPLNFSITPSSSFACVPGPSINMLVSASANFTWLPVAQVTPSVGPLVSVNPSVTTTYTLVGVLGVCSGSTTITIPVDQLPQLVNLSGTPTICPGATATLSAAGASAYVWSPGNLAGPTVTVSRIFPGTYTVTGSNGNCKSSKEFSVFVSSTPNLQLSPSTAICPGESKTLSVRGAKTYTWMPGNVHDSLLVVSPLVNTVYTVSAASSLSCSSKSTISVTIKPLPYLNLTSAPVKMCKGEKLVVDFTGIDSYTIAPDIQYPESDTTYVLYFEKNLCYNSDTLNVDVINCDTLKAQEEFFIPEGFSPDGNGINDYFVIKGLNGRVAMLSIYNRWGVMVYKKSPYDNSWNGRANVTGAMFGNDILPDATYYYLLEFEDNSAGPYKGFVVIRHE